jgi:hypothetical protein
MMTPKSLSIPTTYPSASKPENGEKVRGERKAQLSNIPNRVKTVEDGTFEIK